MGSAGPVVTAASVLPAWKSLAMTDLLSEDWRLARLARRACFALSGQAHASPLAIMC